MKITTILILFLLITNYGQTQTTCCDSLYKLLNGKTTKIKTCNIKSQSHKEGISISIDNSNNNNSVVPRHEDLPNQPNPTIKPKTETGDFSWWKDFFKIILQLLIAVVPLFILIFKYLTQKKKELDERVGEKKSIAYSEFLKNFTETALKVMHDKNVDSLKEDRERMLARDKLLLFANDNVIKAYHNWIEYSDKENSDINREVVLFGRVLLEIRKDIHGESRLTEDEISNLNPFNRG